ncbi:MAG: tryptophan synthase subunit beta, partial [Magnetococcales bacterium]|nr:tryptophan synthase subunit beta [Magnetococcales bacterium]
MRTETGYFGAFGGAFIPEILHETFRRLTAAFEEARRDPAFWAEYLRLMENYSGRPTPLTFAENLSHHFGRRIYIKREDLNQTGAHKANNVMGQGLLMKRMGKRRCIAETGAGQHGMACATMAARMGFECVIYMGAEDVERQRANVFWMERLGARVVPVTSGSRTLKDAVNEAMRDWVGSMDDTHYVLGTACGAHPFPAMVSWFQSVIGLEAREQILKAEGRLPTHVYACVGGGSNAMGIFQGFLDDPEVILVGVEAAGAGLESGRHAARLASGDATVGVAQGYKTYFLQDGDGQMRDTHSVAAGLDYVGVSPILAHLSQSGRVRFAAADDAEVVHALQFLMRQEGIIAALESSHAVACALRE